MNRKKNTASPASHLSDAPALRTGLVIASHGRHSIVQDAVTLEHHLCHPRSKKNEALVGDRVRWLPEQPHAALSGQQGRIEHIEPRRNVLYRQDALRTKSFAANLDQVLILIAAEPTFSATQLLRALLAAAHAGIEPLIVLNKSDLTQAFALAWQRLAAFSPWHTCLPLSLSTLAGLAELRGHLQGRTTLVLGPSGSGKSTLINQLVPQAGATVGEISTALNSGRHTTTATRLYFFDTLNTAAGAIVDSPGFQEFGLHHIAAVDVAHYLPDFAHTLQNAHCRFHNCTHLHEPGCVILAAVQNGHIDEGRWRFYAQLHEELNQTPRY